MRGERFVDATGAAQTERVTVERDTAIGIRRGARPYRILDDRFVVAKRVLELFRVPARSAQRRMCFERGWANLDRAQELAARVLRLFLSCEELAVEHVRVGRIGAAGQR